MAAIIPPAGLAPGNTIITAPLAAPAQMTTFTEYFTMLLKTNTTITTMHL
jgi:hypothetical protein